MMNFVFQNEELCIQNDEFCRFLDVFPALTASCRKIMISNWKTMKSALKMMMICIKLGPHGGDEDQWCDFLLGFRLLFWVFFA